MISNDVTPGYLTAVNPANQLHNNSMDYVAGDGTRVVLQPPVGGTDYVNASWVPGYSGDRAFIISQHPNNFSLEQFWHMVWQTDTRTIVCLSAFQQPVSATHPSLSESAVAVKRQMWRLLSLCFPSVCKCCSVGAACILKLLQGTVHKYQRTYF